MPRPLIRDKVMTRINLMLDKEALENAQSRAAKAGLNPAIAGSSSAFVRWLIDEYNNAIVITACDNDKYLFRSVPELATKMAKFCAESERIEMQELGLDKINDSISLVNKRLKKANEKK